MNKYEIKYLLETMTSSVDRLTDSLGKQSLHIENLWHEIGEKQNLTTRTGHKTLTTKRGRNCKTTKRVQ